MTGILQLLKDTKTNFEASGYPYHMFFGEVRAVSHMGVFNFMLTVLQVSHLLQLQCVVSKELSERSNEF